jgi:hypothetical protein
MYTAQAPDDFRAHISLLFLSLFIFNNTNWHAHNQHYISRLPIYISQNARMHGEMTGKELYTIYTFF